jgi:hypothetical protein
MSAFLSRAHDGDCQIVLVFSVILGIDWGRARISILDIGQKGAMTDDESLGSFWEAWYLMAGSLE